MKSSIVTNPSWWKRRSAVERSLVVIALVMMLASLILFIGIILITLHFSKEEICFTPGCIETSNRLLKYMDDERDPCEDFYEYACGNFLKNTIIPKKNSFVNAFSEIGNPIIEQLAALLDEPENPDDEPRTFTLAKKFYKGCTNEVQIESQGLDPIKNVFAQIGGWPILEGSKWNESNYDWKKTVYALRKLGFSINYLIFFYINTDQKNTSRRVLSLYQPNLPLKREELIKDVDSKILKGYYEYMLDTAEMFGADKNAVKDELMDMLQFCRKLAEISFPSEELRNVSLQYNPTTIAGLEKKYPSIPWLEYANNVLHPVMKVTSDERIIDQIPSYTSSLEALMKVTPPRVISNFFCWRVFQDAVDMLPKKVDDRHRKFLTLTDGISEKSPSWQTCTTTTLSNLGVAVSALYIRHYFDEDSRIKVREMVEDIHSAFKDTLAANSWMDAKTKRKALEKAESITKHVAYPNELLDDKLIDDFYKTVEIDEGSFFKSSQNLNVFQNNLHFEKLRKPVNKSDWLDYVHVPEPGANYDVSKNSINIRAGILHGAYFSKDRPAYMNYGAIGFTIAHEFTHGFDIVGRQYDKNGDLADWWIPETEKAFTKKIQCFLEQYENYTIPEINKTVDGLKTLEENIADNGGMRVSYLAYQKWVQRNGQELKLPSVKYNSKLLFTTNQLFWLSTAHMSCSKERKEHLLSNAETEEHAPNRFRTLSPMSNMPEFSRDFHCEEGSTMNPVVKCQVW